MRCWLLLPVLTLAASDDVSAVCGNDGCDGSQLMQSGFGKTTKIQGGPDRRPEGLKDLADRLVQAKQECLKSSVECLPALKQVRYRVWPYVTHLINWHHKPWEPMDFHPQVVKAKMNCSGQTNYTMFLLHMWKSAGWASMENLERVANSYTMVEAFEDDYAWCEKLGLDQVPREQRSSFTFVRDPLSRLISGYAEIERTYKGGRYDFLKKAESGTMARAKIFMDRYFEDGAIYNGHVKPQSEYFAPFSPNCGLPIDFIGKTEHILDDWKRFMESKQCDAANTPFSNDLGQHPTEGNHKEALTKFFNFAGSRLLSVDTHVTSTSKQHMQNIKMVLHSDDFAYLRAFCWLLFSDYVMFDYDLPEKCNDPEMLQVMNLTKTTSRTSL
mmetsp:Transcript_37112/g.75809  ORF Transcript_37112/g.75809 Transcript_37112/m.75809 type:complete len:384 (-) Transcript_37112:49-1200(-)